MVADTPQRPDRQAKAKRIARLLGALTVLIVTAVGMDAFAYDLGLIEVSALAPRKDQWVILDARPPSIYRRAHLPGALPFSWEDHTRIDSQKIPYRIRSANEIAVVLGALGIDEQTKVVVYGDADTSWGGEGWVCWTLTWMGHRGPIRLLAGGVQAWRQAGLAMVDTRVDKQPIPTEYHFRLRAEVNITAKAVSAVADNQVLVDTRSLPEWFMGHLPAAVHLPWSKLYLGKDRRPIEAEVYAGLLQKRGIKSTDELIFYCTGGVRSAYAWLIHQLYGTSPAKNFEGGTEAWNRLQAR